MSDFAYIEEIIKDNNVVLFMKGNKSAPKCGFSAMVAQALNLLNIDFKDMDVLEDSKLREDIKSFTDWPTIPQLYVNGKFIGGCDIVQDMLSSGELKALLIKEGIISQ